MGSSRDLKNKEKKIFAIEVENWDSTAIKNILEKYVLPGSIVLTDCWKAYKSACADLHLVHKTVNHSENYKDTITGTHTNTI